MKFLFFARNKTADRVASRHEPEGVRILADRYWKAFLTFAIVLIIAAIGYGVWGLFQVLDTLSSVVRVAPPPPPAINRAVLDATMRGFESRRTNFELLEAGPGEVIPDPSI